MSGDEGSAGAETADPSGPVQPGSLGIDGRPARSRSACPPVGAGSGFEPTPVPTPAADADPRPALHRGRAVARRGRPGRPARGRGRLLERARERRDLRRRGRPPLQLSHRRVGDEVGPRPEEPGRLRLLGRRPDRRVRRVARDAGQGPRPRLARGDPEVGGGALGARAADRLRGPHPDRGRALSPPGVRLGRGERGDRRQPAGPAQHGLLARARARLRRRGLPPGAQGRPRGRSSSTTTTGARASTASRTTSTPW